MLQGASNPKTQSQGFNNSRRDFLKLSGTALVAGSLSAVLPFQEAPAHASLRVLSEKASGSIDEMYWDFIQQQFTLKPGLIYMNTGTEGSIPRHALYRMSTYFKEFAEDPWAAVIDSEYYNYTMQKTATAVSEFLGADLEEIVLTTNTTEGMSFVANGLELQEGDEVLSTLHEHEACTCPFDIKRDRQKIKFTQIELPTPAKTKEEIVTVFENAITPQTKVISFCHINYTTGLQMPVKELCQLARQRGIISLVDGAHAIGMLNLNLHELGCDFYACSPHKWLNAPPGTGVLYLRKDVQSQLWPTVTEAYPGGTGRNLFQLRGQQCTPVYKSLIDVIDFQNAIGRDRIQNRILALSSYLKGKIKETWGEDKIFSPLDEELSSGLVAFNPFDDPFDATKTKAVFTTLKDKYHIIIRRTSFPNNQSDTKLTSGLRASTHIFNNYREIDTLISTIQEIIAQL
jgi:selenocysteine lyase/cysteine desulfurase